MVPDLLTFLHTAYIEAAHENDEGVDLEGFLKWSRDYLKANQPTNAMYLSHGLGMRLQRGEVVALSPVADELGPGDLIPSGAIQITGTARDRFSRDLVPAGAVQVTTGRVRGHI